jgi:hypothetical protein
LVVPGIEGKEEYETIIMDAVTKAQLLCLFYK